MSNTYLQHAFEEVCKTAKPAEGWYVSLMEEVPFYGGPEEGGWWSSDVYVVAYQHFGTELQAELAKEAVEKLAKELSDEAKKEYGEQCLREMQWLEERGLDSNFLPEPDGEARYYVVMTEGIPEGSRGCRQYS